MGSNPTPCHGKFRLLLQQLKQPALHVGLGDAVDQVEHRRVICRGAAQRCSERCSTEVQCSGAVQRCSAEVQCRGAVQRCSAEQQRCSAVVHTDSAEVQCSRGALQWCIRTVQRCSAAEVHCRVALQWCTAAEVQCGDAVQRCSAEVQCSRGALQKCTAVVQCSRVQKCSAEVQCRSAVQTTCIGDVIEVDPFGAVKAFLGLKSGHCEVSLELLVCKVDAEL